MKNSMPGTRDSKLKAGTRTQPKKSVTKSKKTSAATPGNTKAVDAFMEQLSHPLKAEMEQVRRIIKEADSTIKEQVKWNAPSFFYLDDIVTFNPRLQTAVHLVFHHPAIVTIKSALLEGDYKDRRMMYLKNTEAITLYQSELRQIIKELVATINISANS